MEGGRPRYPSSPFSLCLSQYIGIRTLPENTKRREGGTNEHNTPLFVVTTDRERHRVKGEGGDNNSVLIHTQYSLPLPLDLSVSLYEWTSLRTAPTPFSVGLSICLSVFL